MNFGKIFNRIPGQDASTPAGNEEIPREEVSPMVTLTRLYKRLIAMREDYMGNSDSDYNTEVAKLEAEIKELEDKLGYSLPISPSVLEPASKVDLKVESSPKTISLPPDHPRVTPLRAKLKVYEGRMDEGTRRSLDDMVENAYKIAIIEYLLEHGSLTLNMANLPEEIKKVAAFPGSFGIISKGKFNYHLYKGALEDAFGIIYDYVETGGENLTKRLEE